MTTGPQPAAEVDADPADDAPLPSIAEQMAEQLGGWRGMVESSIPVVVFVLLNVARRPAARR